MQKEELKSLVREMYDNLIDTIDEQNEASIRQLVNYLIDAVEAMKSVDDNDITTLEYAKETFKNAYKEIAQNGLLSYQATNGKFKEISDQHHEILQECVDKQINLDDLTKRFKNIQSHMEEEIHNANKVIAELTHEVRKLETRSNIDSLTKVFNRRALNTYLNNLCEHADSKYKVHMLMLDIDNFKELNDHYGHVAGDKVLIFLTNILKQTLRDGDKIFRYGGEEFIIVLNRTDNEFCIKIADRILDLIRANHLIYKGESITVTASIGTTALMENDDPDSFVARADKALYNAKQSGKNQVQTEMDENGI